MNTAKKKSDPLSHIFDTKRTDDKLFDDSDEDGAQITYHSSASSTADDSKGSPMSMSSHPSMEFDEEHPNRYISF